MLRPSAREYKNIVGNKPVRILECGVWCGKNSKELYDNFNINELILIDRWYEKYEKYNFPQVKAFPQKVFDMFYDKDNVIIIRSDTLKAARYFPIEYFDYIYLDDNHSYEHVIRELELYYRCVKAGGMISGDNYETLGVQKATNEFFGGLSKEFNKDLSLNTESWKKASDGKTDVLDWWVWKK